MFIEKNDHHVIIAFLLLFVDRKMNTEDLKNLDTFMGVTGMELKSARDAIIREGSSFLESIEPDENRYDCITDKVDRVIADSGFMYKKLPDAAYLLFEYLKLVIFDEKYNGDRKRLLQHLARKWDIDKPVLPVLEHAVKALDQINRKRIEIQNSTMSYSEAVPVLAKVDTAEAAIWNGLKTLDIRKDCSVDETEEDDAVYEEESFVDKVGDCIVEGIYNVGDLICAPFDWMTGKLIDMQVKL